MASDDRPPPGRRRYLFAGLAGAVPATVLFAWMVTGGTWRLLRWHVSGDFYDAQAHALLDGRLAVPGEVLGIEAFVSGGASYMYQGPFPAVLRLPVAALTDSFDGRLSGLSMLLAFVVAAGATVALSWQVRRLVRGSATVSHLEAVAVAGFVFACTGGSALLALASQASVYYESALWGIATGLAALAVLVRHLVLPARWTLAAVSVLAAACLTSRASIGLGVAAAIGMVFLGEAAAWWRARRGLTEWSPSSWLRPRRMASRRAVAGALAAGLLPVLLYAGINVAKFDTPLSVPWDEQAFTEVSADRREFLQENGSFFGVRFVPSTAVQYLRPDAFSLHERFPWIGFRTDDIGRRRLVGGVLFEKVDATGSIPTSFPLLVVLAGAGFVVLVRRRSTPLGKLWAPVLGAAAAAATIFGFGFIALRYLGDVLPLLVVTASVGFAALADRLRRTWGPTGVAAVVALVALGAIGTWVNVGQGLWYQRVYASPGDELATRAFFERGQELGVAPFGQGRRIRSGSHLPVRGRAGELFVVGDCDGLYVSDGATVDDLSHTNWKPVVRTRRVGAHDVDVRFPDAPVGTSLPLLVSGTADAPNVLSVVYLGDGLLRFEFRGAGFGAGRPVAVTPGREYRMRLALDPETDLGVVTLGDRTVFSGGYAADDVPVLAVNTLDRSTARRFGGTIQPREQPTSLCRDIAATAGLNESAPAPARRGTGS